MRVPPARVTFPPEDRAEILARINDALVSGALTLGPNGRELEDQFAARHDVPHAVAVSSGTSALEIIFRALGVDEPTEVGRLDRLAAAKLLELGPFLVGDGEDHSLLRLGDPDLGI